MGSWADGGKTSAPYRTLRLGCRCAECVDEKTCGVRAAMRDVRDATAKILDNTTLADINRRLSLEHD